MQQLYGPRRTKADEAKHLLLDQTQVHDHGRGTTVPVLGRIKKHLGPAATLLTGDKLRAAASLACTMAVIRIYQLLASRTSSLRPHTLAAEGLMH